MSQLTQAQINTIRRRPQTTQLYLSIYQPRTVFAAQVTGSYNQGDNTVSFYAVATGTYLNAYANMVTRLGSTPGGNEYGELRLRSITNGTATFAENEIIWQTDIYLTFIDYVDVVPVYPRIIQDPNNQTNVIFYKDYDIPYSNQNTIYGTFPCAGPHRAGFIVTGAYSTYWSSSGTYNVLGDSLTYAWTFDGSTSTGSTARDPGWVQYTTPGHYKTKLIITSASGAVDTTYRYVSVYSKGQSANGLINAWQLDDLQGTRAEGGYTSRIKIMSILPEIQPKALVVIWAEDSYGGNLVSYGGNSPHNESIVFVGYILQDSIKFNYQQSTMDFDVGSITELMKETEGFSVSCESKVVASTWYELTEMTIQKSLYHYLRWHSTLLNNTDFRYMNDDRYVQYFDSDRESLFDAIDNYMRNSLLGAMVSDRQGMLWAEIASYGLEDPLTTIPTNPMPLDKQDWMNDPVIQERRGYGTSFVELGGIAYYGAATNTFSALIADAPGITPLYRGKTERQEGLILLSQSQLNHVAANYLAYKNSQFPEISMPMTGNYRNIDIAPQEKFFLVIRPEDTIRNVSLQSRPYLPNAMTWHYDSVKQNFVPDLVFEQIATGTASEPVYIPINPPVVDSGYDYPSLQLPTLPSFNPPSSSGPDAPQRVLFLSASKGLIYTDNFDATLPTYVTANQGLGFVPFPSGAGSLVGVPQYAMIHQFFVCPNGSVYVCRIAGVNGQHWNDQSGYYFLARAPYIGGTFTTITDWVIDNAAGNIPSFFDDNQFYAANYNPSVPEQVMFLNKVCPGGAPGVKRIHLGAGGTYSNGVTGIATDFGINGLSYGLGKWLHTISGNHHLIAADGNSFTSPASIPHESVVAFNTYQRSITRANATGRVFIPGDDASHKILISDDNLGSGLWITDANIPNELTGLACDPSGNYLMMQYGVGTRGKSGDGGNTWATMGSLPLGAYYFANSPASSQRWVAANATIRYSPDFGTTWYNKDSSSLLSIVPFPDIVGVQVLD